MNNSIEIGAYFYPLTTKCDVRQARAKFIGDSMGIPGGLTVVDETLLTQQALPLFEGHEQPNTYCLDITTTQWDDSDEEAIDKQIGLATDAGLDFFVFDAYEGIKNGKPTIESAQPIEIFRKLSGGSNMKYAKLETFASPRVVLPVSKDPKFYEPDRVYDMDEHTVRFIVDTCVANDWNNPNYFMVAGRPYLSLFIPDLTPGWHTGTQRLRHIIGELYDYANRKYKIDPYIVGSIRTVAQARELTDAGAEALTGYAFLPVFGDDAPPIQQYDELLEQRKTEWKTIAKINTFNPPAVVGWDASPRGKSSYQLGGTRGYGYAPIVVGNSPQLFEGMLHDTLTFSKGQTPPKEQYGIICAWNEVTEGAALLPRIRDNRTLDTSYLDAVRRVTSRYK